MVTVSPAGMEERKRSPCEVISSIVAVLISAGSHKGRDEINGKAEKPTIARLFAGTERCGKLGCEFGDVPQMVLQ
jgi:hypothetical protein